MRCFFAVLHHKLGDLCCVTRKLKTKWDHAQLGVCHFLVWWVLQKFEQLQSQHIQEPLSTWHAGAGRPDALDRPRKEQHCITLPKRENWKIDSTILDLRNVFG